jgi:hypothetical protein
MEKTIKDTLALLESNSISKETAYELIEAEILAKENQYKNKISEIKSTMKMVKEKMQDVFDKKLNDIKKQVEALKK